MFLQQSDLQEGADQALHIARRPLGRSPLDVLGPIFPGAHICHFYESPEALLEVTVPFFAQGLERNESCFWAVAGRLSPSDAEAALRRAVPDFDERCRRGQIEIVEGRAWYAPSGKFDPEDALRRALEKERCAVGRGFQGLRISGDASWLTADDWRAFARYESAVNASINRHRIVALCSYSIDRFGALELIEVMNNHQIALTSQGGRWQVLANQEHRRAEAELRRNVERLELLAGVTADLLASDKPQEIVEALCRRVMAHLDCHAFFNFLVDPQAGRLHLNACAGIPAEAARAIEWLDFGVAVCGCAARDGCRIVAENVPTTPDPRTDLVRSFGIKAYACHPLLNQGQVIGTLSFGSRTKCTFQEDELALMKAVTDQVAIAMQRLRLLESLEQRAAEAQAASVAKSQFLTNISHELRTPMNAILGMTELALSEETDPAIREQLRTAKESADGLLELLNEILDFSRTEAGKFHLESRPFSLRNTLDLTLRTLTLRARQKGLSLICDLPDDVPDALVGDPLRLRQVLVNIVGNGIKFTHRGTVALRAKVQSQGPQGVVLEFAVSDTGIGIAAADQERIFAPFTQVDATMTRQYGGTGLGLSIASHLVGLMGGRIRVKSDLGRGSTFSFTVRFHAAASPPVEPPAPEVREPAVAARPLRILLAEDTPANQKLVVRILSKRGHTIEVAANGREAVERIIVGQYDVVLMDIQMPTMDGFEATAAIRALPDPGKARLPILAMTAHAMQGDRQRCLAAGADDYLSKPVNARDLVESAERLASIRH